MSDQTNVTTATWPRSRIIAAWVAANAVIVGILIFWPFAKGDPMYYFRNSLGKPTHPSHGALPLSEYPDAGLWPVRAIIQVCGDHAHVFLTLFSGFLIACSTVFFFYLLNRSHRAALFWTAFTAAAGPIVYSRLDLIPGLLVAATAAALFTHPKVASALLGFAAMSKLWPAALAAGLVDRWNRSATWARLATFGGTLVVVGAITALTSGWDRLVSPLTYQDVRGLQIESILATPLIVAAAFFPGHWHIDKAPSKSFEIFGPGVDQLVTASSVLMACTMLFGLAWALWHFLGDAWSPRSTALFFLTMVLLLIVSNKVFSPQYVVWFGPVLAVLLAKQPGDMPSAPKRAETQVEADTLRKLTWLSVLAAGLTTVVFPFTYNLLFEGPHWFAALVLTARNILMVYITYLALKLTIHAGLKSQPLKKREAEGVTKKERLKEKA
ncbi:Predicted integral membrane protein [Corynebacterium jeikeium]|uniref:Putative membrane protein n=1 Tax=Corynebacterium jeikeium (strain K411) TaxID=306537 RepID=Q4JWG6_CORJK|nr:glycosyltransferase 87 family protein [Corynebacterium jeikeium]CAI36841.1 putative membrane protein [Corynebacterium jeikeium K411]SUY85803.1 Predicted integral membrane protein [Corynebacterium jeikeium]